MNIQRLLNEYSNRPLFVGNTKIDIRQDWEHAEVILTAYLGNSKTETRVSDYISDNELTKCIIELVQEVKVICSPKLNVDLIDF